ncbi:hypothetical protein Runsl_4324 [Runella slithyformis DSM 19594]|uniref:Uncharacterized protein n=1 Tax=Runella slithyformis (strain ATCC 29530 / DSM 19594 / LMG 11500 / NCIMB 11436 / LSU 4) TaxID=761193 RepID=A0A7U3ZNW8_RUNSL|nr:hypothetical protein Runsl_4324 [Runella slithyformis DSM 19594]
MDSAVLMIHTNYHTYKMAYLSLLGDLYVCMNVCMDNLFLLTE